MQLLNIKDLDLYRKKVFIRCDFNVPMDEFGNITDDRRIRSAVATINYCLDQDCAVVLASHMGRPKGEVDKKYSLEPVQLRLQQLLKRHVELAKDVVGEDATKKAAELPNHEVLLIENLRFEKGETKNDEALAKVLEHFNISFKRTSLNAFLKRVGADTFPESEQTAIAIERKALVAYDRWGFVDDKSGMKIDQSGLVETFRHLANL